MKGSLQGAVAAQGLLLICSGIGMGKQASSRPSMSLAEAAAAAAATVAHHRSLQNLPRVCYAMQCKVDLYG